MWLSKDHMALRGGGERLLTSQNVILIQLVIVYLRLQKPESLRFFYFFSSFLVLFEIEIIEKNNKTLRIGNSFSHLFCGKSVMGLL